MTRSRRRRTGGCLASMVVVAWLSLPSVASAAATELLVSPTQPTPDTGVLFERPDWNQASPKESATIRTRRAAALVSLLPASLLVVLYLYRPKPYLLAYIAGWTGMAVAIFLGVTAADRIREAMIAGASLAPGRLVAAAGQISGLAAALLFLSGARLFDGAAKVLPRVTWLLAIAVPVFPVLAVSSGARAVLAPGYVLTSGVFIACAITSALSARRLRLTGGLVIAIGFAGIAANTLLAATLVAWGQAGVELPNGLIALNAVAGAFVAFGMFLVVFQEMTFELRQTNARLAEAQDELETLAVTDPLTGCFNRRFFDEVVAHELQQHQRIGIPMSLLFIDCDRFKRINDTLGHDTGDLVLRAIADLIRSEVRQADYVFRWGGDEFLVMISCDEVHAAAKAHTLRESFAALPVTKTLPAGTGLSIGWVGVPSGIRDLLPFVQAADRRMYAHRRESA